MTAKYDENLLENSYFKALRNKRTDLWKDAVKRKLWVGTDKPIDGWDHLFSPDPYSTFFIDIARPCD